MRILETIAHPSITISILQMNDKFIVKFEAGPMEQSFKFSTAEVKSVGEVKKIVNEAFIESVRKRFNEMYLQYQAALKP